MLFSTFEMIFKRWKSFLKTPFRYLTAWIIKFGETCYINCNKNCFSKKSRVVEQNVVSMERQLKLYLLLGEIIVATHVLGF